MSDWLFYTLAAVIKSVFMLAITLGMVPILLLLERRISAFMQHRYGPNRVGPFGVLQPLADAIKFIFKEDVVPRDANPFIFTLAPALAAIPPIAMMAVVPFGDALTLGGRTIPLVVANVDIGILFVLAASSMAVYGITLGGWASASKYSLLGGLRASAQMISYELAMGLSVVGVLMVTTVHGHTGSLSLHDIARDQIEHGWNVLRQPLAFCIFLVAAFAETNRLPFDLPEAEPELVGGYHTEYSAMSFALFFMGEYAAMVASSAVMVTLFFGGWHLPGLALFAAAGGVPLAILQFLVFMAKVMICLLFFIQVRWTLPRFRYDQLMNIGWKVMLPAALANILITGFLVVSVT
ncbi:MAG: NADH-quinone oxidoreductase subunit NuoH [Planctomycetota bacterium]